MIREEPRIARWNTASLDAEKFSNALGKERETCVLYHLDRDREANRNHVAAYLVHMLRDYDQKEAAHRPKKERT